MHQGSLSRVVRVGVTGVSLMATCACSVPREILELEVSTWWAPGSEEAAFEAVKRLHEEKHPTVRIESTVFPEAERAREYLTRHVLAGAAPDTFQANIGADLIAWTMVDPADPSLGESFRHIEQLDDLLDARTFWNRLPTELVEAVRVGELAPPYAIPINIHRLNLIHFKRAQLEKYEAIHGKGSFLDLSRICPVGDETPIPPPRLALGGRDTFPQILLLFENLIPALAGPQFYEAFLRGSDEAANEAPAVFDRALRCLRRLANVRDRTRYQDDGWKEALGRVRNEDADYTVMGDWANGHIVEQGWSDIESAPFPGTWDVFVFTSDTFPLPVSARHPEAARDLLVTIASDEAQKAFSGIKGSIPALLDVGVEGPLADQAPRSRAAFDSASFKVMATSGYFPPYLQTGPLSEEILNVMVADPEEQQIALLMDRLSDYPMLFSEFQARIQVGPSKRLP